MQPEIKTKFGRQILNLDFQAELNDVAEIIAFSESFGLVIRSSETELDVSENNNLAQDWLPSSRQI